MRASRPSFISYCVAALAAVVPITAVGAPAAVFVGAPADNRLAVTSQEVSRWSICSCFWGAEFFVSFM